MLYGPEAAAVMKTKPTRVPDVVLSGPHEAAPSAYHADWTLVPGSHCDSAKWELELKLRDKRNRLIHEHLTDGRNVFYKSSGNSMWPLVQSGDACLFYPIQAVTAAPGDRHSIQKEKSEIGEGDVVFCRVQTSNHHYAHIVFKIQDSVDVRKKQKQFWIGNILGRCSGWCHARHIYGILAEVQVWGKCHYCPRPLPKDNFLAVRDLVQKDRWSDAAEKLCQPPSLNRSTWR